MGVIPSGPGVLLGFIVKRAFLISWSSTALVRFLFIVWTTCWWRTTEKWKRRKKRGRIRKKRRKKKENWHRFWSKIKAKLMMALNAGIKILKCRPLRSFAFHLENFSMKAKDFVKVCKSLHFFGNVEKSFWKSFSFRKSISSA